MAGTTTATPPNMQLALATQGMQLDQAKREANALKNQLAAAQNQIAAAHQGGMTRAKVTTGLSSGISVAAAFAGGYGHGYLESKNAHKVGPVSLVSLVGLGAAAVGVWVDDRDGAEALSALGRGLASGAAFAMGADMGRKRGQGGRATEPAAAQNQTAKR